jgi:hypothetical protein
LCCFHSQESQEWFVQTKKGKKIEVSAKSNPSDWGEKSNIISGKNDRLYVVSEDSNEEGRISISIIEKTEKPNLF